MSTWFSRPVNIVALLLDDISLPRTGRLSTYSILKIGTLNLAASVQQLRVIVSGANINLDYVNVPTAGANPPVFSNDPINLPDAPNGFSYSQSIAGSATDPDSDPVTHSIAIRPDWRSIASDATASGTPGAGNVGPNSWVIQASDGNGGTDTATLNIAVDARPPGC